MQHVFGHEACTFYVYSATSEWSYFSGNRAHIPQYEADFQLDAKTGHASVIFTVHAVDEEKVYAYIEADVRALPSMYVTLYVQQLYYEQKLQAQQQQHLAVVQLVGALNSSRSLTTLLQKIMDYTLRAIPSIDRGFLMLIDQQQQKLYTVASKGVTDAIYEYISENTPTSTHDPSVAPGVGGG